MQRAFWISLTCAMGLYLLMVFWSIPFVAYEAGGQVPFDMRPMGYGLDEARSFLQALTAEGRAFYLGTQLKLDLVYPALLGLSLILGLQLVIRQPWSTAFGVVALMATASDYFENFLISVMLHTPVDEIDEATVQVASFLTLSKSIGHTVCFVALLTGAMFRLGRRLLR
ncbi:hypothetical protein Q4578_02550 [Shimia thalassica]|uniref:hypothetical protein n=1 Tax=Shimia thalassica TaxID=1715693 RepID=UPI002494C914|nr:hypothetical protein [Shimia thalassica]MDO6520445.1 hypothetical protein [Shimia thalassica]MDP2519061.1 hypothetical protein [Shimia thalassica]